MKKILFVFGTRPEAIKMCPLIIEAKNRKDLHPIVCVTGQHREMLDQVLDIFSIVPDYDLSIMKKNQTLFDVTTNILDKVKDVILEVKPDICLVHGDTTTTFATSLACYYLQVKVGHVEAGLRTGNIYSPFPEEFNRLAVSLVSNFNFAPTLQSRENLINEGKNAATIYVTGNTAIDALRTTINDNYNNEMIEWAKGSKLILLTAHRRENLGEPLKKIFRAIKKITEEFKEVKIIYPIHLNPQIRKEAEMLSGNDNIRIIEPLNVIDFHNFLAKSYLILTDSGGIQEEAPSLGKPVLVLRDTTERPEGVEAGTLKLVGTNETNIYNEVKLLLTNEIEYNKMSKATNPYGDGTASKQICDILEREL